MALTPTQLSALREYVGTNHSEDDLEERYIAALAAGHPEPLKRVATAVLNQRLADFEANPGQFSTEGLNIGTSSNISSLRNRLKELQVETLDVDEDSPGRTVVRRMVRPDWVR